MAGPSIGGKAEGLRLLVEAGEQVPPYVVLEPGADVPAAVASLGPGPYAVRSSASDEDGSGSAQAGRYESYLNVAVADVAARVAEVRRSYGNAEGRSGAVIVQPMIESDVSGVAFSVHPAGILDQVVASAGAGAGAVVAGPEPARTWVTSTPDGRRYTYATSPDVPELLTPAQVDEVVAAAARVAQQRGAPIDIEWAYADGRLWLLQARPITTLAAAPRSTLDNANLVESYPGLVSPLTASFVPTAYEGVFRSLALRVTRDPELVAAYGDVLPRMVAGSSGRLYYRMESWYAALALMPFARRYIDVWQTSLGIEERSYESPPVRVTRRQRIRTAVGLVRELRRTPRELDRLQRGVTEVVAWFPSELARAATIADLTQLYDRVESELLSRWDVTLLNDARAFVAPALLRLLVRDDAAVNRLVSGIAAIESLKPVRELTALAADAPAELGAVTTTADAERFLAGDSLYAARLRSYIETYGDRYLEELKLESPTFRTDPLLLVQTVRELGASRRSAPPESDPRPSVRSRNPFVRALARAATEAIAGRESARLDRARVYGMVRAIVGKAGALLAAADAIDEPGDVFWLRLEEVLARQTESARSGPLRASATASLRDLVGQRKRDQAAYALLPPFRRLTFAGEPFDVHVPLATATETAAAAGGTRTGLGVSGGVATGQVLVVTDPRTVTDAAGKVLVTPMTDPGWVFLISRAAAVVAERGSLLSHTAIVARELGVPAVVGIPDATRRFVDGEVVTVDGGRGEVRR